MCVKLHPLDCHAKSDMSSFQRSPQSSSIKELQSSISSHMAIKKVIDTFKVL